jgi:hypothetical protein
VTDVTEGAGLLPATLRVAIVLLIGEAAVVTVLAGAEVYNAVTASRVIWQQAGLVIGYASIMAVLMWVSAWALSRRHAWARGPAVVLQLMLLPIGYFMVSAGLVLVGVPVLALGLLGAGLLVAPATRAALGVK